MTNSVTIEYKTRRDYCHCCSQKLPKSKTSEIRKFRFRKQDILDWSDDWTDIIEFESDLQECVREFTYETIGFFATDSEEEILIENSEFDKVKQFILDEIIGDCDEN